MSTFAATFAATQKNYTFQTSNFRGTTGESEIARMKPWVPAGVAARWFSTRLFFIGALMDDLIEIKDMPWLFTCND